VEEMVHVEVILLVAIIAIARKVIILDVKTVAPLTLIGVAAIILELSIGYYCLKRALGHKNEFGYAPAGSSRMRPINDRKGRRSKCQMMDWLTSPNLESTSRREKFLAGKR